MIFGGSPNEFEANERDVAKNARIIAKTDFFIFLSLKWLILILRKILVVIYLDGIIHKTY